MMNRTHIDAYADIMFTLEWKSPYAHHTENHFGWNVNFWRDFFPASLYQNIIDKPAGSCEDLSFNPGGIVPDLAAKNIFDIKFDQFNKEPSKDSTVEPRTGRYYPKGLLKGITNVFKENITPFRCAQISDSQITVDFNHPLAGKELRVKTRVHDVREKRSDTGGTARDWIETLTEGPGMQVRWNGGPTDFFSGTPFARTDESPDNRFYEKPRFVNHIDDRAIQTLSDLYGTLLKPGTKVLDLMSSWTSHMPADLRLERLAGLGMNQAELKANPSLSDYVVQDLNENPRLPFGEGEFDAVLCALSVEYLIRPFEIFQEANRVLKPGGAFIVSFSNRWFPPKSVKIWQEIHEFERMGLVLEYFMESGRFTDLSTFSMRGLPRPYEDKYYGQILLSDPMYCVQGRKHP